jgi:hypothetical protein
MARPKSKRRVHKEQLAMAVRKSFNSLAVNETDVWVDWAYTVKHSGRLLNLHARVLLADDYDRQGVQNPLRTSTEVTST